MLVFMRMTTLFGVLFWMDNTKFLMWPPLDSLEAIDQLVPFVFQAFQTLSISITLLWQKLNFLWCIFMYPKCCSVLPGSIAFPVVWWCKNTLTGKKKGNIFYLNVCTERKAQFEILTRDHEDTQRTNYISVPMPCWALCLVSLLKIAIFRTVMAAHGGDMHLFPSRRHKQMAWVCSFSKLLFLSVFYSSGVLQGTTSTEIFYFVDKVAGCWFNFSNLPQSCREWQI